MFLNRLEWAAILLIPVLSVGGSQTPTSPAPQVFRQEIAFGERVSHDRNSPVPALLHVGKDGALWVYADNWRVKRNEQSSTWEPGPNSEQDFIVPRLGEQGISVPVSPKAVKQVLAVGGTSYLLTASAVYRVTETETRPLSWPHGRSLRQIAVSPTGALHAASDSGLLILSGDVWQKVQILDRYGRDWAAGEVLGVGIARDGVLWAALPAGVARRDGKGWQFYGGADGVPWTDFTWVAPGKSNTVWFGTHLGAVYFDGSDWHYRQGKRWLVNDDIRQVEVDDTGNAWFITPDGLCGISRRTMTLQQKAAHFESEIERYIKRTPYGFVSEAALRTPGDPSSADPQDSDNDGLWTAMYGAGQCFAYAAIKMPEHLERARKAFEALKFLQDVTRGGAHSPPAGYVARTIRPVDWPDPNIGRLEHDKREQQQDRLWKVYEPRWPKSADGQWYWKSDTSSDELDGHYFFYPLYYEFCAESEAEKARVREVVRSLTDHLVSHDFCLVDLDGKPTRWGVYSPKELNRNPDWWQERGLKSLSILSYLAVASYITGDEKYKEISRELVERQNYAHNAMHPKVQHGPGSGNQSDDEMAFMCFYNLLRYSTDQALKDHLRVSFYRYWLNEAPENNPFFNFAYAAHGLGKHGATPWGSFPLDPIENWLMDSLDTLRGFPLDRLNWGHQNRHRLDVLPLARVQSGDFTSADGNRSRGYRVNGKVLSVENRHFSHWNTDPWRLDYPGNADELAAGTVFLLPYYMGLYHGYIQKPIPASQNAAEPQSFRAHE